VQFEIRLISIEHFLRCKSLTRLIQWWNDIGFI